MADLVRSAWATTDPLLQHYYDTEWGLPVLTEQGLFERISLEGFQAGLSWLTVLRKRPRLRERFAGFDVDQVAAFTDADVASLLTDPGIIRHRGKIASVINNARCTQRLRQGEGLARLVWSFRPDRTPAPRTPDEVPTSSPESVALSRRLRAEGFTFVGPTTMYALMEAAGLVDTHLVDSWRRGSSGIWAPGGTAREPCVRVAAVVITDDKGQVLMVRKQGTTSFMLPGGKHEPGESARATTVRELHEELGLVLDPDHLELLGEFVDQAANEQGLDVVGTVFVHHGLPPHQGGLAGEHWEPLAELAEVGWFSIDPMPDDDARRQFAPLTRNQVVPRLLQRSAAQQHLGDADHDQQ